MTATIQTINTAVDLLKSLLWQYNKAEKLQSLLQQKQDWYDANQVGFWNDWVRDVFDLRTANEFGLRVWAIILNIKLFVSNVPPSSSKPAWGFGSYRYNFRGANFTDINGSTTNLPLEIKRLALRLRYFQLSSSGTPGEINRMLAELFGRYGGAYLLDGLDMTQTYVFRFKLPSSMRRLFDNFDVLPRPAGVNSNYIDSEQKYFGFGTYRLNFNRGNFGA